MPTRYLKPGICDSPHIDAIKSAQAECLYYRLLVTVDDYGRYDARPALVKARCYPLRETYTSKQVQAWLLELHTAGLIALYGTENGEYLQILRWDNKPRASESKFPPIPTDADGCIQVYANAGIPRTVLPVTVTDIPKHKPKPKQPARAVPIPDWLPEECWENWKAERRDRKKPMTPRAEQAAINALSDLRNKGHDPAKVIQQSIANGWAGLFELKHGNGSQFQQPAAPIPAAQKPFAPDPKPERQPIPPDYVRRLAAKLSLASKS
jgi:hypothetical protein